MQKLNVITLAATTLLLLSSGVRDAGATTIEIAATVSDRGIDMFPWDGVGASVFGNPSVVQITTPPIGMMSASEERTAAEFPLGALLFGSIVDSVALRLYPQGLSTNLGLSASEISEIHGYAGDGVIQVADLMDALAVGSIVGPTANGPVTVVLSPGWLQGLVDSSSPFAGLMFKGVPGPVAVVYTFDAAFAAVPLAERPTLIVDYHEGAPVIPEPSTLILVGSGVALSAFRKRRSLLRFHVCVSEPYHSRGNRLARSRSSERS